MRILLYLVLAAVLACRDSTPSPNSPPSLDPAGTEASFLARTRCAALAVAGSCSLYDVSLIELIARPERYDGKRVRVQGYVNFEFEGNALYLSRDDWQRGLTKNGLWIERPDPRPGITGTPRWNRRDVLVEATFNASNRGHLGLWSGALLQVSRLEQSDDSPMRPDEKAPPGQ